MKAGTMDENVSYQCPEYLGSEEALPILCLNDEATEPVLFIADHAGNSIPKAMDALGLRETELEKHIAWDPGARNIANGLAGRFKATAVLAQYSRLIIDLNRPLGDLDSIPLISDGTLIPANQILSEQECKRRAQLFYFTYHNRIDYEIARLRKVGPGPLIVSIHSFTPQYGGVDRPWHIGIMSANDRRLAEVLLDAFRCHEGLLVGDNQPYSGFDLGYTLRLHAGSQGLAHVQIEIRQDLLVDNKDEAFWINLLFDVLSTQIKDPRLLSITHF